VPTDLSRRDLLRLGLVVSAGAGLAACTTASSSGTPTQTDPGGPEDPDRALRAEVASDEARLTALYAAAAKVLTGTPAARAAAVGQRHEAYRAAVLPAAGSASASGASGATGASAAPTTPAVVAGTALKALVTAETAAAAARATQSARATDAELARVIVLAGAGAAAAAADLSTGRVR
jgi:hypothetical protein